MINYNYCFRNFAVTIFTICGICFNSFAQTGIYVPSMRASDSLVTNFMATYGIPAATVALAKDGKLVYMRAFGTADQNGKEPTEPYHMFRIASLSKQITSTAIMKLMEQGKLNLNDHPFGKGGILDTVPYFHNANITDARIYQITLRNLLEHTAGWNRDIPITPSPLPPYPYGFSSSDPISFPLHVTLTLGEDNPVTERALIKFLLERGLDVDPGTEYHYSNIGYLILGEVIEHLSGMSYEDYVKKNILDPIGAYDMHLGKNLLKDKMEREGEYNNNYTTLSCYGTGEYVPWQYGGWNLEAMDAHGGWIATARDLLKFVLAVDKFNTKPDILSAASIDTMTTPSAVNQYYAKGWQVNQYGNWWHTGALDGTASELVRTSGGYAWVIILNERNLTNSNFWPDLDNLGWNCIATTSTFPGFDLLDFPTQNCTNLSTSVSSGTSVNVKWTNGNGDGRILIAHADSSVNKFPLDGTDYSSNSSFGAGTDLGNGNFVIYSGTANNATVTNLDPNKTYYFRVVEFNKNSTTGDNALYQLANGTKDSIRINVTDVEKTFLPTFNLAQNYPNPFNPSTTISWQSPVDSWQTLKVYDILGKEVAVLVDEFKQAGRNEVKFDASRLASGVYFYRITAGKYSSVKKMLLQK